MLSNKKYFKKFAWFFLFYNIYTILGGAYVRATGSGAGCGAHWPLCKGEVFPDFSIIHTIIEFTHRVSSGLVTAGSILLLVWSFYCTEKGDPVRKAAIFSFIFVIFEALLGAGLVLFGLVANNSSLIRAFIMALHLTSTFMLLGSISLTAAWSSNYPAMKSLFRSNNFVSLFLSIIGLFMTGASGAITALGDTLYKPHYVGEGLVEDLQYKSHILKSIRIYHPVLAIVVSLYCIFTFLKLTTKDSLSSQKILFRLFTFTAIIQIIIGFINIAFLAPVLIQIIHLLFAVCLWILAVLLINNILATE